MTKYDTPLEAFTGEDEYIKECYALYHVRGRDLVPDEISAALSLQPTKAWQRGDVAYVTKRGEVRTKPIGAWYISTQENVSRSIERHCAELVDRLRGREFAIQSLRESKRYRIVSQIIVHTGGPDVAELDILGPTLAALASLCDDVEFHFCGCRRGITYGEPAPPLALDDLSAWAALNDAYGPADGIPAKIRQLESLPPYSYEAEPYNSLWKALCHHDVYAASYAAVPHFARIIENNLWNPNAFNVLELIVAIEANRLCGRGPRVPVALIGAYESVIDALSTIVSDIVAISETGDHARIASAAIAVSCGRGDLALTILGLADSHQTELNEVTSSSRPAIYALDGARIVDLESFYDEVSEKIVPGATWGRNLNAFNDILKGGFGTPEGGFVIRWNRSEESRVAMGAEFYQLVAIIRDHGAGGRQADDGVRLRLA